MICRAESTWDRACCLAKFPSRLRRILASDGRLGFVLLCPLILLFTADESLSDWTPVVYISKTKMLSVTQDKLQPWTASDTTAVLPHLLFMQWLHIFKWTAPSCGQTLNIAAGGFTPKVKLESSSGLSPKCITWDSGRKLDYREKIHTGMGKTCELRRICMRDFVRWQQ